LRFKLDQLAEQGIVLGVGDLRLVQLVVLPVRPLYQRAKLDDASLRLFRARRPTRAAWYVLTP